MGDTAKRMTEQGGANYISGTSLVLVLELGEVELMWGLKNKQNSSEKDKFCV